MFEAAPECEAVGGDVLATAATEAAGLVAEERGPLPQGRWVSCTWEDPADAEEDPARFLEVRFQVYFTAEEGPTGEEAAAEYLEALAPPYPESVRGAEPGDQAVVRGAAAGPGAEVVFRRANLLVQVAYGGTEDVSGDELESEAAREAAAAAAQAIDADL